MFEHDKLYEVFSRTNYELSPIHTSGSNFSAGEVRGFWGGSELTMDTQSFHYSHPRGLEELRSLYADVLSENVSVDNISVTPGAKFALYVALRALVSKETRVCLPKPGWPVYEYLTLAFGGSVEHYDPLNIDELVMKCARNERAVIVINYPHNPTGRCLNQAEMEAVISACKTSGSVLVSDEVYRLLVAGHPSASADEVESGGVVVIDSISKWGAAAGLRVGFLVAQKKMLDFAGTIVAATVSGTSSASQLWAAQLLMDKTHLARIRERVTRDLSDLEAVFSDAGEELRSAGGIYLWVAGGPSIDIRDFTVIGAPGALFGQSNCTRFCPSSNPHTLAELRAESQA